MKGQNTVFSKLTADEMKNIKGGMMPPMFKWKCRREGVEVTGICFALGLDPETQCGYDHLSCSADGVCGRFDPGGCV